MKTIKVMLSLSLVLMACYTFSQSVVKSSIDSGGASVEVGNIQLLYTIGEVNVQETTAGNINISEGFINTMVLRINISPMAFLQGPYDTNTGLMSGDLRNNGIISTSSPYADDKTADSKVFDLGGISGTGLPEDDIIDWVWLEIRDKNDNTNVVESQSALVQRDGDIVDIDGVSALTFNSPTDYYYIMISHRNHLGILTANPVNLAGGLTNLDLTSDSNLVFGTINAIKDLGDGNFALYAGDFNGDGQVQNTDKSAVEPLRGISGYNNADIDMNGEVQNTDLNGLLIPNLGKGEQYTGKQLYAKRKKRIN